MRLPALAVAALALLAATAAVADAPPRKPPPPIPAVPEPRIPVPKVPVPSQLSPPPARLDPVERSLAETTRLRLQHSIDALQRQSDMAPLDPGVQGQLRDSRGDLERLNRTLGR